MRNDPPACRRIRCERRADAVRDSAAASRSSLSVDNFSRELLGVYRAAWPTLAIATYVATSRLHDNVHYLSGVVFGAALGTATGWTVVGPHGRTDYTLAPTPIRRGMMVAIVRTPASLPRGN